MRNSLSQKYAKHNTCAHTNEMKNEKGNQRKEKHKQTTTTISLKITKYAKRKYLVEKWFQKQLQWS